MTSIFLSYARGDDEAFVRRLYSDLKRRGFHVWYDRVSLPARKLTFYQEIRDAIADSERLLLVVGPKAIDSDYVAQEWRFALAMDVCVNPIVRLDGRAHDGEGLDGYSLVPEVLKLIHIEDFRDDARYDDHLANLVRQLSDPAPPIGKLVAVPSLPAHYSSQPERLRHLREAVLTDLQSPVVVSGAGARIGVEGMGGIGKSVLAAALAGDLAVRRAFPDGIFWISMGQQPNLVERQRFLAKELQDDPVFTDTQSGRQRLKDILVDRRVLLILDDVWHRPDADAFDALGPRCKLILTTRDAGLVTALAGTDYQVQLPSETEALALLASAAQTVVDALPRTATEVVNECGRLPLALALCGGMVCGGTPWEDLLQALREHDIEFPEDKHASEIHHTSIWRTIQISVNALDEHAQRRFAELAVFPEDVRIPEDAVLTLWGHTAKLSPRDVRRLLTDLKNRSLLQLDREPGEPEERAGRISIHDLVHDYAIRLATGLFGSTSNAHRNLIDAFRVRYSNTWRLDENDWYWSRYLPFHLGGAQLWDELLTVIHNPELRYVTRWIEHGEGEIGLRIISALVHHLEVEDKNSTDVAGLSTQAARICSLHGRFDEAKDWLERHALPRTGMFLNRRIRAITLHEMASLCLYEGKFPEAASLYRKAYRLCSWDFGGMGDEASANLVGMAAVAQAQRRHGASLRYAKRALKRARLARDVRHEAAAYRLMGAVYLNVGKYEKARAVVRSALRLCRDSATSIELPRLQLLEAWITLEQARLAGTDPSQAFEAFQESLRAAQKRCNLYCTLESKIGSGWCELVRGNTTAATSYFRDVSDNLPSGQFSELTAGTRAGLAAAHHQAGHVEEARRAYEDAAHFAREHKNFYWESKALVGIGALCWHAGERDRAEAIWNDALHAAQRISVAVITLTKTAIASCQSSLRHVP